MQSVWVADTDVFHLMYVCVCVCMYKHTQNKYNHMSAYRCPTCMHTYIHTYTHKHIQNTYNHECVQMFSRLNVYIHVRLEGIGQHKSSKMAHLSLKVQ